MSAPLSDAPKLPGEVWRGTTSIFHVAVTVEPAMSALPIVWRLGEVAEVVPPNDPHGTHAMAMTYYAEAMRAEVRRLRAEVVEFQRNTGCANGGTIGTALANIKRILRDGEEWPSPIETITDLAERVVRERNEASADATRAAEEMRERAARAVEALSVRQYERDILDDGAAAIRALPTEPER